MTNEEGGVATGKDTAVGRTYDLERRTLVFAERVIDFALEVERNPVTLPLITQLVRAATSIGANYCEADDAESKKDFRHKIGLWPQRSSRDQVLVSDGRTRSRKLEAAGQGTLERSQGTAFNFFQNSTIIRYER
jgi:23S rRNA-intervening sequence protein